MKETERSIDGFEPKEVFKWFKEITAIPRGSKGEKAISDHLMKYAESKGLEVEQDAFWNLVIRKPASKGYESKPPVILQAHMDMVWNPEEKFKSGEPINPIVVERPEESEKYGGKDWMVSEGHTTLGADDGIGLAYNMALIDSTDIPHPPLEIVFTTQEELGMEGAKVYNVGWLKSNTFINIDSEDEHIFTSSCCGGMRMYLHLPTKMVRTSSIDNSDEYKSFTISVSGLAGGHSGVEIDKERGNSNRLLGRVLADVVNQVNKVGKTNCYLASIKGGITPNAIPPSTEAVVFVNNNYVDKIKECLLSWQDIFRNELKYSDGATYGEDGKLYEVKVEMNSTDPTEMVYVDETFKKVLTAMTLIPHGVANMDIPQKMPETSDNFAMIEIPTDKDKIIFTANIRSSIGTKKEFIASQFYKIADIIGANVTTSGVYPAWPYKEVSPIRDVFKKAYENAYGNLDKFQVLGIHAGLECGIFSDRFEQIGRKNVDMIAFGPTILGAHTPDERLHIASVERTWKLLKEVLQLLANSCNCK